MNKWTFEALPATWEQGISVLTVDQIRKGVAKVLIVSASDWPPVLSEFIGICKDIGFDFTGCFGRFMGNKKPINQFERLVFADAVHANVKLKAVGEDERLFKKVFYRWVERFSCGEIPQDVPALPPKAVVMPTDIARESHGVPEPSQFEQNSVFARIAALGKKAKR